MSDYDHFRIQPDCGSVSANRRFPTQFCVPPRDSSDAVSLLSMVHTDRTAILFSNRTRHAGYFLSRRFSVICGSGSTCSTVRSRSRQAKASRRGEILNDLPDRVSDIVIFVGVAHSGLMNPFIGYWAAILACHRTSVCLDRRSAFSANLAELCRSPGAWSRSTPARGSHFFSRHNHPRLSPFWIGHVLWS